MKHFGSLAIKSKLTESNLKDGKGEEKWVLNNGLARQRIVLNFKMSIVLIVLGKLLAKIYWFFDDLWWLIWSSKCFSDIILCLKEQDNTFILSSL